MSQKKFFKDPALLSGYEKESPILLGLSGGADSSALLHLLCDWAKGSGATVYAAHVNHGIRKEGYGNEADRDEQFCRELCASLGVEVFVSQVDIPKMAEESGRSIEEEAREARYSFFSEIMREKNIKILATAHNADDNLETQIYNMARGCGIDGLVGIPEMRKLETVDEGIVVRPILAAQKREILEYCKVNSVPYVTDSTNNEEEYTRNAIRHKVMPILREMFPHFNRSSQRLSATAGEDSDFILSVARKTVNEYGEKIPTKILSGLHPSVAKRVIKLMFEQVSSATLEYVHVLSVMSLLDTDKNGSTVSLPDRICAKIIDGELCFCPDLKETKKVPAYCVKLEFGFTQITNTRFAVLISDREPSKTMGDYSLYATAKADGNLPTPLYAKNRQSGMTITDGGINKKIKKLMCDKKVPLCDRDTIPLISSEKEILYAPLCALCDSVKPSIKYKTVYIGIYAIGG